MASHSKSICGIEFGHDALCVIQFDTEASAIIGIAIKPLEQGNSADWWSQVREEFKSMTDTMKLKGQQAICSLPDRHAIIKELMVNSDEPDREAALRWELSQQLVGQTDELLFSYTAKPSTDQQIERYLAVACNPEQVNRISSLLKGHKIKPAIVELDIFSLINVFCSNYQQLLLHPALLLHSNESSSTLILTQNGQFIDLERFDHTPQEMEPAGFARKVEERIGRLRMVDAQLQQSDSAPLFISGSFFAQEDLRADVLAALNNAEVLYPFKTVECRALPQAELLKYAPQLSVATGLALRGLVDISL